MTTEKIIKKEDKLDYKSSIIAYQKTIGNIWRACEISGVKSRKTFYNWCKTDPDFKEAVNSTLRMQYDYIEDALMMKIARNHGPTMRWFLSRKHPDYMRKRGTVPPKKVVNPWEKWSKMPWPEGEE